MQNTRQTNMIITNCAACAAPLAHNAPRCVRCKTRYCDSTCQHDHWRRGHKQICKKIHRGGNAEQYHAAEKCKEAIAVAVEACAEDTKGQTCYICTEAVHWKTREGIVRGCACRGTAGFAHVSCLAEQAKILIAEAEEDNLAWTVKSERWSRWHKCSLCEQNYHGVVQCGLGWACWKTNLGRPEEHWARDSAMMALGHGLSAARRWEEALTTHQANLAICKRHSAPDTRCLDIDSNIATCYALLGRGEESLALQRSIYARSSVMRPLDRIGVANNLAEALGRARHYAEAKNMLRKTIPEAQMELGDDHRVTLTVRCGYASSIIESIMQGL